MDSRLKISGMTAGGSFLNGSITLRPSPRQSLSRGLQYLKTWIPNKRFWEWREGEVATPEWFYRPLFVTPAIFKPGSMVFKNQRRRKNLDSRLKISGMTREGGEFLSVFIRGLNYLRAKNMDSHLLVTPAIFKPGSMVFKSIWMPDKKFQAWQKEKPSEGEGRFRELAGRGLGWINYRGAAPLYKPPEKTKI